VDKRIEIIPLRDVFLKTSIKNRSKKAIKEIKEYVSKHVKIDNVKIAKSLNEFVWKNGCSNIPRKVKVQVLFDKKENVAWVEQADVKFEIPLTKVQKQKQKEETTKKEDKSKIDEVKKDEKDKDNKTKKIKSDKKEDIKEDIKKEKKESKSEDTKSVKKDTKLKKTKANTTKTSDKKIDKKVSTKKKE
jgi:large subunit ribosomal protein L31e